MDFREMRPVQNQDTAWRCVDDECIIITPRQSMATVLNPVGTRVWELSDGTKKIKDIMALIFEEYETDMATIERDVKEFFDDLVKRGLMRLEKPS